MKSIFLSIALFASSFYSVAQSYIIDGYTDKQSYRAGETVSFFLNAHVDLPFPCSLDPSLCCTLNPSFCQMDLHLFDMAGNLVATIPSVDVMSQNPQPNAWEGFGYTASAQTWTVPSSLKSGYYFIPSAFDIIPIIIKNANYPSTADIVVVAPTNTINAYTSSGGKSLYIPQGNAATTVSFLRPQSRNDYQHYDDGFFRWIITSGMTNNYNISFISDMDMDDYDEIGNTKLLIVPGHSEYWSRKARLNFDKFVDAGKDAMILSGNSMWWQVRYEDANYNSDNTKLTCYRNVNLDNINNSDQLLVSIHWGEPTLKYSILGSIGTDWLRGGIGVDVCSGSCPIPCYDGFNGHKIVLPQSPVGASVLAPDVFFIVCELALI